ncbi:probable E3 ubiquitin ligase complex SCF subunit sconB [Acanthaster planci]|uniref:Probable E3 ubiquitin ligase complex SCF subunit sconB n=1 Tax=Acanthaster planci TaxID=133434 RepID=A0A8B7XH77_ACAPL|nr:probable E3 ubiquitin ligase complex SCF subunit sconB [Acanthaster planci]
MADAPGNDPVDLPYELLEAIFQYLGPADLCRLAVCSRRWRCVVNQDCLWRPLCRGNGWQHYYGAEADITKEEPYEPRQTGGGSGPHENVAFQIDSIIAEDNPTGIARTCKWKEVYLKAQHLESNWENSRCHVATLKVFDDGGPAQKARQGGRLYTRYADGDGDFFALSFSDGTIKVWDVKRGTCAHVFQVALSKQGNTLKVKRNMVVVGCARGLIRAFSVKDGQELPQMKGHKETADIECIFFDGETVVSRVVRDDEIRVWGVSDGICRHILASPDGAQLRDVDYRDQTVVAVYGDSHLRVWDAGSGRCVHASTGHGASSGRLQSLKLGRGIVASLHHAGPGPSMLVIRSAKSGDSKFSLPVEAFVERSSTPWIDNCFANGGLLVRDLPGWTHDGMYLNARNGSVHAHYMTKLGFLKAVFRFHGNRCVIEDRYNYKKNDYLIYKACTDGLKLLSNGNHGQDSKRLALWMDNTKIVFHSLLADMNLYVHHYW